VVGRRLTRPVAAALAVALLAACGDDSPRGTPATTAVEPPGWQPKDTIPDGELVAVPIQNRPDPAKGQFQVKLVNGTREQFNVSTVQFVWAGLTTDVVERDRPGVVVGGQRVDYPVPLPAATCVGDGTRATMPSLDTARVLVTDEAGSVREVPVVDPDRVIPRLYEEDCRRQFVEAHVTIEWVGLREGQFDGRPVTVGELRLTRSEAAGEVTVESISDTIPFLVDPLDSAPGEVVATLAADADAVSVPVQFLEGRCDPHALAEITQPTKFIAQVRFDDGEPMPYIVYPDRDLWAPMLLTADQACVELGKVVFVGDG